MSAPLLGAEITSNLPANCRAKPFIKESPNDRDFASQLPGLSRFLCLALKTYNRYPWIEMISR